MALKCSIGVALSGAFLLLAFGNVQWERLGLALNAVDWAYLFLGAILNSLSLIVRGLRWRILLASLGPVSVREAFAYINIGYMANNLLPLRVGEIVRPVLLAEKKNISKSAVLATVVIERVLDILTLLALTVFLLMVTPVPIEVRQSAQVAGIIAAVGAVILWYIAARHWSHWPWSLRIREMLPSGLTPIVVVARSFIGGLVAVRSPMQVALAMLLSALAWATVLGSTYLLLQAIHLELAWYASLLVIVVVNFGSAIPSSPGFIGVIHFLVVTALAALGADRDVSLSFAILFHALPFVTTVTLGLISMWWQGIGFRGMKNWVRVGAN